MKTERYKRHTKNSSAPGGFMDKGEPKMRKSTARQTALKKIINRGDKSANSYKGSKMNG